MVHLKPVVMIAGSGAVQIEFGQVGTDHSANQFLAMLENDPEVGKDIDTTSYYVRPCDILATQSYGHVWDQQI